MKVIQPYAHCSTKLAQWQMRVRGFSQKGEQAVTKVGDVLRRAFRAGTLVVR